MKTLNEKREWLLKALLEEQEYEKDGLSIEYILKRYELEFKEFIKNCLADGWDEQFVNPNESFKAGVQFMKERIVKYAGEYLK